MPTLYISEFTGMGLDASGRVVPAACVPPVAQQAVAFTGTSAQSAAMNAQTSLVRVQTDTACALEFGTNPTATATKLQLSVNSPEYFTVPVNTSLKIAAITV